MNKFIKLIMGVAILATISLAGGNAKPINDFGIKPYIGVYGGYNDSPISFTNTIGVLGGVEFNKYSALEARYSTNSIDNDEFKVTNASVYGKLQYPVEKATPYALIGYADSEVAGVKQDGFSYGVGIGYEIVDNVKVFGEYVVLQDSDINDDTLNNNTFNIGVKYDF